MFDFEELKNTITDLKQQLREDDIYGNSPLVVRKKDNEYTSGVYNGIFDLGLESATYTHNTIYGILEPIKDEYTKRYSNLVSTNNADFKYSTEIVSGEYIIEAFKDSDSEVFLNVTLNNSGEMVSGELCELKSYSDDLFKIETIFFLNIK